MLNNPSAKSRVFLSVIFAALTIVSGLTSCGGQPDPIASPSGTRNSDIVTPPSIAAVQAAWEAEPVRGTEYYYCDCGTGSEAGCVVGNDANAGTSKEAPRRTIANAVTLSNSLGSTLSTISFCKGGAFNVNSPLWFGNISCPANSTCRDLREYEPTTFAGTAAPLLFKLASSVAGPVFNFTGGGGVRVINLELSGSTSGNGIFIYNGAHDIHLGNLTIDRFPIAIYPEISGPATLTNIKITGNTIKNSSAQGFLGAADGLDLNDNYFSGNGSSRTADHSIYLSADGHVAHNVNVKRNHIYGQFGPLCKGVPIVGHGAFDGINIDNNHVEMIAIETTDSCQGISLSGAGYPNPQYFNNLSINGNTVINGGNVGIATSFSPGAHIENNLVIMDWAYGSSPGVSSWPVYGMLIPASLHSTDLDNGTNTASVIQNNTIWFGPLTVGGTGIKLGEEGTNHIITNNSISSVSARAGGFYCFDLPLTVTDYAVVDNNHCDTVQDNLAWNKSNGPSLSAWQANSGHDANSREGSDPQFVNATSSSDHDFRPITGSPLIGTGHILHKSTLDKLGVTRPNSPEAPAIGAFEP